MAAQYQPVLDRSPVLAAESSLPAVSWSAILAGAAGAIAVAILLGSLAAGLGLTSVSAWPNAGASATQFTIGAGIGLIVIHWLSSAMGGFITGRLRTKWTALHTHEVFFRDTAHGFLAWALASIIGATVVAMAASSIVAGGVRATSTMVGEATQASGFGVSSYAVDGLLRPSHIDASTGTQDAGGQVARILANGVKTGNVPDSDRAYLTQLVESETGIQQDEAQKRVDAIIGEAKSAADQARQTAEAARKSAASFGIFTALAMLIGAFVAMVAAAVGGTLRDES